MWPKEITREGKPLTSADGEIYGDLFIAEGLAEFSKATREVAYWDQAKQILLKCVRLYDRPDYRSTIGQTYLGPGAPPFPGARTTVPNSDNATWVDLVTDKVIGTSAEDSLKVTLPATGFRAIEYRKKYARN